MRIEFTVKIEGDPLGRIARPIRELFISDFKAFRRFISKVLPPSDEEEAKKNDAS